MLVDVIVITTILSSVFPLSSFNLRIGLTVIFVFMAVYLAIFLFIWLKSTSRKELTLLLDHLQKSEIEKEIRDEFSRPLSQKLDTFRLHKVKKLVMEPNLRKSMINEKRYSILLTPKGILNVILLALGFLSAIIAIIYTSSILTFIGLGFILWGVVLLYVTNIKYIRLDLLTATISSMIDNVEKIIISKKLSGKGIYLPQRLIKDSETSLIFIPSKLSKNIPSLEKINKDVYSKTLDGVFLTPLGLDLSKMFEKELQKPFTRPDLYYLQNNFPKIIKKFEIAENVNITIEKNIVVVEYINQIFKEICNDTKNLNTGRNFIGCPLCSAFACILSKITCKPIMIEKEEQSQDGRVTTTQYRILDK